MRLGVFKRETFTCSECNQLCCGESMDISALGEDELPESVKASTKPKKCCRCDGHRIRLCEMCLSRTKV